MTFVRGKSSGQTLLSIAIQRVQTRLPIVYRAEGRSELGSESSRRRPWGKPTTIKVLLVPVAGHGSSYDCGIRALIMVFTDRRPCAHIFKASLLSLRSIFCLEICPQKYEPRKTYRTAQY